MPSSARPTAKPVSIRTAKRSSILGRRWLGFWIRANPHDPRRGELTATVRTHIQRAHANGNYERALDYLSLLKPLYQSELPPSLLLDFAQAHERIAEQHQARASKLKRRPCGLPRPVKRAMRCFP